MPALSDIADKALGPRWRRARRRQRRIQLGVLIANLMYLLLIIGLWVFLQSSAESWWLATLLLFGPLWVFGLPLFVLAPAAFLANRRVLVIVAIDLLVLMFGILDFNIPWRTLFVGHPTGPHIRVLTCNIHRHQLLSTQLAQLIDQTNPDVVAIQEWTSQDQAALFGKGQWYLRRDGELLLASRTPIKSGQNLVQGHWGAAGAAIFYQIDLNGGELNVINLHLASPHIEFADAINGSPEGPDEVANNSAARADQSLLIANFARSVHEPVLLMGDFNTPVISPTFQNSWIDYSDAFSSAGWGLGHTYFTRWASVRIDHILVPAAWAVTSCWVGPNEGSPHRPVIVDLQWVDPAGWKTAN